MIRAHLEHLCAILFCAVSAALLAVIVVGALVGGARNGLLYYLVLVAAVSFLLGVPYSLRRWWHFATTGKDDWIVY